MRKSLPNPDGLRLAEDPNDSTRVIVVDDSGVEVRGKSIVDGDGKGPLVQSPDGTWWRLGAANDGTPSFTRA